MSGEKHYVAVRRFNRYRVGQSVYEIGAKLQGLIASGLVEEVKIAPPEEVKTAEPVATAAPAKRVVNAKPKPKRRRKPAQAA